MSKKTFSAALLASLLCLSACSHFGNHANTANSTQANTLRIQGTLQTSASDPNQWLVKECRSEKTFLIDAFSPNKIGQLLEQTPQLEPLLHEHVFIDVTLTPSSNGYQLEQILRLQEQGPDCSDNAFKKLYLRASGHEPSWHISVESKGLLLEQIGQPPIALPYIEERLPSGGITITSEHKNQPVQLWLSPTLCTDSMSGTVSHLTAQLTLGDQVMNGCGYFGLQRN